MELNVLTLVYLLSSVTFIIGLKNLSHPATARRGNLVAATGMTLAILATIFLYKDEDGNPLHNYGWIFGGLIIGGIAGTLAAKRVKKYPLGLAATPNKICFVEANRGFVVASLRRRSRKRE